MFGNAFTYVASRNPKDSHEVRVGAQELSLPRFCGSGDVTSEDHCGYKFVITLVVSPLPRGHGDGDVEESERGYVIQRALGVCLFAWNRIFRKF